LTIDVLVVEVERRDEEKETPNRQLYTLAIAHPDPDPPFVADRGDDFRPFPSTKKEEDDQAPAPSFKTDSDGMGGNGVVDKGVS